VPLGLFAAGPFGVLDPASPHNEDIEAIRQAGITKGCDPPEFASYCPKANVTREEMASFLARTAGLGANPPVANALTAVSAQNAISATNATNATNAISAQQAENADLATNATYAADADRLGGQLPSAYLRALDVTMRYTFMNVVPSAAALDISQQGTYVSVQRNAAGSNTVYLPLDRPTSIGGLTYRIKSVKICYQTDAGGARIVSTILRAGLETGSLSDPYSDNITRPATAVFPNFACYTVEPPGDANTPAAIYLLLNLNFPDANDDILLGQVKVILTPDPGGNP
jgi:hypothetical protein